MHPEAYEGFGWALHQTGLNPDRGWRVLDVGGQDINGTCHDWLPNATILTLDLEHADIHADARTWVPDDLFDIAMATEVFEHVQDWRAILSTMAAALDPAGPRILLITCAATGRPAHGATGAPLPAPGEWYGNLTPSALSDALAAHSVVYEVRYDLRTGGDLYAWAITRPSPVVKISPGGFAWPGQADAEAALGIPHAR